MITETKIERELYEPTSRFLNVTFLARLKEQSPLQNLQIFVCNTSLSAGGDGGQWTRPDVSALVLGRGTYVPHWKADLHTFEVKTAGGLNETAVHEANAHGRFANYSWLVFQSLAPSETARSGMFARVTKLALHLGVGVIHFADPTSPNDWVIQAWPKRTGTDSSTADSYVRERFDKEARTRIANNLDALGWAKDT